MRIGVLLSILTIFVIVFSSSVCTGQKFNKSFDDSLKTKSGQANETKTVVKDSARLAIEARSKRVWIQSLILPGLGQYTNGGSWWLKIPVIYGGFLAGILTFDFNQQYYEHYLAEAKYRIDNNDAAPPCSPYQGGQEFTTNSIINAMDYHRRNRDLTVLCLVGWWGLNAVEAYCSDMLKNRWSISNELSVRIYPTVTPSPGNGNSHVSGLVGLKIQVGFEAGS